MKLNLNSWHAKLYKNSYNGLPETLCPYFWKLLLAIVLLPITFVGYLFPFIREAKSLFLNFLATFIAAAIIVTSYGLGENFIEYCSLKDQIIGFMIGLGTMILVFAAITAILFVIFYLDDYLEDRKYQRRWNRNEPKKQWIIVEWWKGFYGKYCPRINWE